MGFCVELETTVCSGADIWLGSGAHVYFDGVVGRVSIAVIFLRAVFTYMHSRSSIPLPSGSWTHLQCRLDSLTVLN